MVLEYGFKNKTHNTKILHHSTYRKVRDSIPTLNCNLVETARDQAKDMLKRTKFRVLPKRKRLQIRYDQRTFKFYPDKGMISLSTCHGRKKVNVKVYDYCKQYLYGWFSNAQLIIRKDKIFMNIQSKLPDIKQKLGNKILGIDRGITNIVTCSDNTFYNSKHMRKVKGNFQYLRTKLQSVGTRSARRKLKQLSGRERRFTLNLNHKLAKEIASKDYDVFVVEKLDIKTRWGKGRVFNKKLGNWSYSEFLTFLRYKAENLGKTVVEINPRYTSQQCSKCGFISRGNRHKSKFKCLECGFELNADLNAARNIGQIGKSELARLSQQAECDRVLIPEYNSIDGK